MTQMAVKPAKFGARADPTEQAHRMTAAARYAGRRPTSRPMGTHSNGELAMARKTPALAMLMAVTGTLNSRASSGATARTDEVENVIGMGSQQMVNRVTHRRQRAMGTTASSTAARCREGAATGISEAMGSNGADINSAGGSGSLRESTESILGDASRRAKSCLGGYRADDRLRLSRPWYNCYIAKNSQAADERRRDQPSWPCPSESRVGE